MNKTKLHRALEAYIESLPKEYERIDVKRIDVLSSITNYVKDASRPKLHFICTHNSRRSHLGQIWAQTAADFFGIVLETYSGGTEATAFHPNAISALERAGFRVEKPEGQNPKFRISRGPDALPMVCFSKKFDEQPNPKENFAAIMTCSEADAECPIVPGAATRIKVLYDDPKEADGRVDESTKYDERCRQIAREMFFAFSQLK